MATKKTDDKATKKTDDKATGSAKSAEGKRSRYFILNPAGAIHEVTKAHAAERLRQPGYRQPTKEQVKAYLSARTQTHDDPIGEPWAPEPEAMEIDVEAIDA